MNATSLLACNEYNTDYDIIGYMMLSWPNIAGSPPWFNLLNYT